MTLTLAAIHAAQAYNGDAFYATVAAVIPVLFLALTLQGDTYGILLTARERVTKRFTAAATSRSPTLRNYLALLAGTFTGAIAQTIALLILAAGTGGEIAALWSLYDRQDVIPPYLVLIAAAALAGVIGVKVLWSYSTAGFVPYRTYLHIYWKVLNSTLHGKRVTPAELVAMFMPTDTNPAEQPAAQPPGTTTPAG